MHLHAAVVDARARLRVGRVLPGRVERDVTHVDAQEIARAAAVHDRFRLQLVALDRPRFVVA